MAVFFSILLWILKSIGWILLGVIGLVLLLLVILLVVPIRYRVQGEFMESSSAYVRVSWMLRLIQADLRLEDKKLKIWYRIAWFRKYIMGQEIPEPKKVSEGSSTPHPQSNAGATVRPMAQQQGGGTPRPQLNVPLTKQEDAEMIEEVTEEAAEEVVKQSLREKLETMYANIRSKILESIEKVRSIIHNIEIWKEKIEGWIYQFQVYPGKEQIWKLLRKELLYIIKKIRPVRCRISMRFGMENPATTGQIMGIYGIVTSVWGCKGYHLDVEPDFDNKVFEGTLDLKGRIALYVIVFAAIRVYFNKRIQKLIKDIKKIKENL